MTTNQMYDEKDIPRDVFDLYKQVGHSTFVYFYFVDVIIIIMD